MKSLKLVKMTGNNLENLTLITFILVSHWSCFCFGREILKSSNLPIFILDTRGKIIKDSTRIKANMKVIWDQTGKPNHVTDTPNNYNGTISIEKRGTTSQKLFPKKQYAVTTQSDSGTDIEVSLLGLPKDEDWILHAPYSDKSLIRNALTYTLGRELGHYATRARFCELIINNDYKGLYLLVERIKRGPDRVDIAKLKKTDNFGDDVTGGYILKVDKTTGEPKNSGYLLTPGSRRFLLHYPSPEKITKEQLAYIKTTMAGIHNSFHKSDSPLSDPAFLNRLDINSFYDYYIISEFSKNVDAYRFSQFMHKDKESKGGKLSMGPIWDFNIAYGNVDYHNAEKPEGLLDQQSKLNLNWWKQLSSDPLFTAGVKCRWESLRQRTLDWPHIERLIDSLAAEINEAKDRNFTRWDILNKKVWPNYYIGGTYSKELSYLKSWLVKRIAWLDNNMPGKCTEADIIKANGPPADVSRVLFAEMGTLKFNLVQKAKITVKLYDLHGRPAKTILENREFPSGRHYHQWESTGDNGAPLGKGMYALSLICNGKATRAFKLIKLD